MRSNSKRILLIMSFIIIMIIIDQLAKIYIIENMYNSSISIINGILNLTYVENTGGAFGIFNNNIILFILINIIIIIALVKYLLVKQQDANVITLIAISMMLAGGIGNIIDRIFRGHVIDYIDISPLITYPVFNFADICVVIGVVILIIDIIINRDNL